MPSPRVARGLHRVVSPMKVSRRNPTRLSGCRRSSPDATAAGFHRMSKAFTRDDVSTAPLVVPPRAPLPPGTPNYVTARGLRLLRQELAGLEAERIRRTADREDDPDRGRMLA